MTKKSRSNQATSEVLDIVLLLGITIALFTFLNYIVFSYSFDESSPSVSLIGSIDKDIDKDNYMINIEHNGGESLEENTEIIIIRESDVFSETSRTTSGELLGDDGPIWDFGEIVQFHFKGINDNLYIF